jgi:hypothetical protein
MYCPHDDIAAGGDDADGDEDCRGDCSTSTVAAAPTSSISPRPRAPPSKDPLVRGKAGSLGKWGRLIRKRGGGRSERGERRFGAPPRGFAVGGAGDGMRNQRGKRSGEESYQPMTGLVT